MDIQREQAKYEQIQRISHHAKRMIFVTFQKRVFTSTRRRQQIHHLQRVMNMMLAF